VPRIDLAGLSIAYDVIGSGAQRVVITPGGRFSKDVDGIRELAAALAAGGCTVLVWDRPNCGESSIDFSGPSESRRNADMLAALVRAIEFGPALLVGGSGGARETLLAAIHHPDIAEKAFVLWLSGGGIGIATLPVFYCADGALAAENGGMAAVAELPGWQEQLDRWPDNRAKMLAMDPAEFIAAMRRWGDAFLPAPGQPIPCVSAGDLDGISVPVMVLRSGESDHHHPRATSEAAAAAIPGAILAEPPWDDREWLRRLVDNMQGRARGPFAGWPALAPQILTFAGLR
jgi:pimeloyl-ACP methyl ester carboxylesterase